ncbi:hypothetical protein CAPTEDRAFT_107687 [Capitella teleta]|uniref:LTD domain-containing protein n=1 Tax=Capitella teleta TaxID=283909 RepID=R7UHP2_CAPTE|nr:hypothetical protein CAPTEDRAFT_107687 [Capitella teleta]|eukprot:ELU05588.1 hypothetical protein CAPTEDRAFT_107687 [Capitella teleta]
MITQLTHQGLSHVLIACEIFQFDFYSSTGNIRIMEVHPDGKYIRLHNTSTKDDDLGGYMIQQNVGGHPVAIFRFPTRVRFPANATATVWAGSNDPLLHQPPSDFIFKEQLKWGTGPECTSILCKPNNQV